MKADISTLHKPDILTLRRQCASPFLTTRKEPYIGCVPVPFRILAGLYYPMIVASMTFIVGCLLLKETHGHKIWDEVGAMK